MQQFSATIVSNKSLSRDLHKLEFEWDTAAGVPAPGQFFTLRVSDSIVPFLRRPFAFSHYDAHKATASAIYQRRGRGTEILSGKIRGETIDIIGPLGNSFPPPASGAKIVCIGGGIGLGPIVYLARHLTAEKNDLLVVVGCRAKENIPDKAELEGLSAVLCTDDGSEGFCGTIVDYLKQHNSIDADTTLYACGPMAMLKGCHELALSKNADCFVSVEQVMACGVGACMGCAVKVVAEPGYARVCKEGPVFNSRDIAWT